MNRKATIALSAAIIIASLLMLLGEFRQSNKIESQAAIDAGLQAQRDKYKNLMLFPVGDYLRSGDELPQTANLSTFLSSNQVVDFTRTLRETIAYLNNPNSSGYFELKRPNPVSPVGPQASNYIVFNKLTIDRSLPAASYGQLASYITNRFPSSVSEIAPESIQVRITQQDVDPMRTMFSFAHGFFSGQLFGYIGDVAVPDDYPDASSTRNIPCLTAMVHVAVKVDRLPDTFPLFIALYWSKNADRWTPYQAFSPNPRYCTIL